MPSLIKMGDAIQIPGMSGSTATPNLYIIQVTKKINRVSIHLGNVLLIWIDSQHG